MTAKSENVINFSCQRLSSSQPSISLLTFKDSPQDGLGQFRSGSKTIVSTFFLNKIKTQSMIRMIR